MKTIALIVSLMTLVTFNTMGQNADINKMMENPQTRDEIYSTIMNSHEYMGEFMKAASQNKHATMMMQQKNQMTDQKRNMQTDHQQANMDHENTMNGDHMGMNNDRHRMDRGQMMQKQQQVMGMMMNEPTIMPGVMDNMMNYGMQNPDVLDQMVNVMAQYPKMVKMADRKIQK